MKALVEAAHIAMSPGTEAQRAEALLDLIRRVIPYDGGSIDLYDPERRGRFALATAGETRALQAYCESPEGDAELDSLGLNRPCRPMLHTELPTPLLDTLAWSRYLWPSGCRGSVGVGLFTRDARHVGHLTLLSGSPSALNPENRDVLASFTPLVAHAVDRMRSLVAAARIVREATAAVVLTGAGNTVPLPGRPDHRLLTPGSPVLVVAAGRLACGDTQAAFLCPDPRDDAPDALVRVTVLNCAREQLDHLVGVVTLSPPGRLRGLTRLDLQVLGMIVDGSPGARIVAQLGITEAAAESCAVRICAALAVHTGTAAAVRAVREGLYIPPALLERRA
jgi:hypothetical protein